MLIALVATIAFFGLWLTVLRPKPAAQSAAAPAQSGKVAPDAATAPAGTTPAASAAGTAPTATAPVAPAGGAATVPVAPAAGTAPASGAATAPATSGAERPAARALAVRREARVLRELAEGKVVVLLFWTPRGADDRAARRAVQAVPRRGGKVAVHVSRVERVADYERITRGVTVAQSPTTLVIAPDRRARAIVGLTEPREVAQAVGDALRRR